MPSISCRRPAITYAHERAQAHARARKRIGAHDGPTMGPKLVHFWDHFGAHSRPTAGQFMGPFGIQNGSILGPMLQMLLLLLLLLVECGAPFRLNSKWICRFQLILYIKTKVYALLWYYMRFGKLFHKISELHEKYM
jgi:hypothetical protein